MKNHNLFANLESLDKSVYLHNLIRAFVVHMKMSVFR